MSEENDVRATLEAAYDELASNEGHTLPVEEETIDGPLTPKPPEGRNRDEAGRFASKDSNEIVKEGGNVEGRSAAAPAETGAKPKADSADNPVPDNTAANTQADRSAPPQRVGAATKAAWNDLPEAIRNEIWEREERMDRGMARYAGLAEFAVEAERNGKSLREVMSAYTAAEERLVNDPIATLADFCKMTNTHPFAVAQLLGIPVPGQSPSMPQSAPQGTPPVYADPRIDELLRREQQREAMEAARQAAKADSEVQSFLSNTKQYPYAENVRVLMGQLLEKDLARSLEDAYQQAIYLDPAVRKLVEEDLVKTRLSAVQQQQQAQNARVAVQNAKRSSGSLSGSPIAGGSSGNSGNNGPKSVADSLREAYDSLAG